MDDILKSAWGDLLNENEKLAALLDEKDAEIDRLQAALSEYADEANWRLNGKFDPNSPWFQGRAVARAALARKEGT